MPPGSINTKSLSKLSMYEADKGSLQQTNKHMILPSFGLFYLSVAPVQIIDDYELTYDLYKVFKWFSNLQWNLK